MRSLQWTSTVASVMQFVYPLYCMHAIDLPESAAVETKHMIQSEKPCNMRKVTYDESIRCDDQNEQQTDIAGMNYANLAVHAETNAMQRKQSGKEPRKQNGWTQKPFPWNLPTPRHSPSPIRASLLRRPCAPGSRAD